MKYVRLTLDAGGRADEIHPMYDLLVDETVVDRATAMHWNITDEELGIMHFVEGDANQFIAALERIPEVRAYEIARAGDGKFYVYVRDEMSEPLCDLFSELTRSPVVVIPPVTYESESGTVSYAAFGPAGEVQTAIDRIPEPIEVTVSEIGGLSAVPGIHEPRLSPRQREALTVGLSHGYYEIPREASHVDVARAMGCAPSTAAEHLRKGEANLLRSVLRD
ncbi:helix-turn-helix domain-containing protein [Halostagnicola sp. A-GB9-2]|uniref:helix-turn-helix domain-containing protein n=1 Tax=Halostagnicola sp. A-GB9-2 TaxID=3048066 RepID=UPI0024C076FA|nr:helix-turn-helix domain-containing protein [Halostagnicola sp. A-GB9-2]MDJ1432319.1 helix-turn-helix domain-containing protein [Halostagnicola sp. A-GB9-2]